MSRPRVTSGDRTRSAGSSARRTAANRGRRSSSWTRRPALQTWRWTRATRACSTPGSGRLCGGRGSSFREGSGAPSGNRPMAATPGRGSRARTTRGCPKGSGARSAWRRRGRRRAASSPRSRRKREASSSARTAARSGSTSTTSTRSASARGTTPGSIRIRRTPTRFTCPTSTCTSPPTAGRRSRTCRCLTATTTISGSIRTTRNG